MTRSLEAIVKLGTTGRFPLTALLLAHLEWPRVYQILDDLTAVNIRRVALGLPSIWR